MRLHDLKPAEGAHRDRKRLGRGNASGQGTTAGKGTKGEKARAGGLHPGFRGMSSRNQRMAKRRGFKNPFHVEYQAVNVGQLSNFPSNSTVDETALIAAGLARAGHPAKILAKGDITIPIRVSGLKMSGAARQKIEAAGGSVDSGEAPVAAVKEEESGDTGGV